MTAKKEYDVVVVGGGLAGVTAAIAARRGGAKTLLVERLPFVGGAWTGGMVTHIAGLVDHTRIFEKTDKVLNPKNWIVKGLACEYHERLAQFGAAQGAHWDHEAGKVIFDLLLEEAQVDVLYGTEFFRATTSDGRIQSLELIYRTTSIEVEAAVFVDASGDGDLAAAAGADFYFGRESDGLMSPATLSYMVGNIDPNQMISEDDIGVPIGGMELPESGKETGKEDINTLIKKAEKDGRIPRGVRPAAICLKYAEHHERQELWCSFVRQWGNITDPWEYSRMEREGRKAGWQVFRFLKENTQSWREAYLSSIGCQIWPRECRHFRTEYAVKADDFRNEARFDDAVARCAFYLDLHSVTPDSAGFDLDERHRERDKFFQIPYRSLLPVNWENLLLAGRCIGADHLGHSAIRVMGTGISTGQAAGTAAAMLARNKQAAPELNVSELQQSLRNQNVVI